MGVSSIYSAYLDFNQGGAQKGSNDHHLQTPWQTTLKII